MSLRLILVGFVAALGWELPSDQDLERYWHDGREFCLVLRDRADQRMPDGLDAFTAGGEAEIAVADATAIDPGQIADKPGQVANVSAEVEPLKEVVSSAQASLGANLNTAAAQETGLDSAAVAAIRDEEAGRIDDAFAKAVEAMARDFSEKAGLALREANALEAETAEPVPLASIPRRSTTIVVLEPSDPIEAVDPGLGADEGPVIESPDALAVDPRTSELESAVVLPAESEPAKTVEVAEPAAVTPSLAASSETEPAKPAGREDPAAEQAVESAGSGASTVKFAKALRLTGQALEAWASILQGSSEAASSTAIPVNP